MAVGDGHSWGGGAGCCEHPLAVGIMAWGLWGPRGKVIPAGSCKEASCRGAPGWVLEGAEANWVPLCVWGWGCWAPTHVLAPHPGQRSKHMSRGSISSQDWSWHPWVLGLSPNPSNSVAGGGCQGPRFLEAAAYGARSHPPSPGTHYIRGVNNTRQPWHSSEGRKQYSLKPANPTEEGLASLHSVLFRKQPFLWRAALLYYTIERASRLSFSALFQDLEQYVQDAGVRWEYCVRAKRGQTDTSQPGISQGVKSLQVLEGIFYYFFLLFFLENRGRWTRFAAGWVEHHCSCGHGNL